ncbi:hypothetical protein D6V22_07050 [Vibrio cholerae]|nr:hypothetical protein [Vibrio cholerae]GHZ47447.1 hypothetical protein VCSRO8_2848 [Vibrio cholerae]
MEMKMSDVFGLPLNREESKYFNHLLRSSKSDIPEASFNSSDCAKYAAHAINNHDRLVEENKKLHEALEQAKAMSIESINREDLVILISTGFRHAEIKGSFEIDDLYAAFDSMVYKRKKLLSEIGGE